MKFFDQVMSERINHEATHRNGGLHETLNLLYVSRCEMLHFVTSYTKQKQKS